MIYFRFRIFRQQSMHLGLESKLAWGVEHLALGGTWGLGRELVGVELAAKSAGLLWAKINWLVLLALQNTTLVAFFHDLEIK